MGEAALDGSASQGGMVMDSESQKNAKDLEQELTWLSKVVDARLKLYFGQPAQCGEVFEIAPPDLSASDSKYAGFISYYRLTFAERLALILSLAPLVRPRLLDLFRLKNQALDSRYTEFGGTRHGPDDPFEPTGETLAFILGADNLEVRFAVQALFEPEHFFSSHGILRPAPMGESLPLMKAPLKICEECLSLFTTGRPYRPSFGAGFPAQYIETALDWNDLVLHPGTRSQVEEIETWIEHGETLMKDWQMAAKLRPGYRSLFYGPPGTGKTMTACLLGKTTGRDVYKVDLSLVVSKYIGETEKNLARVFDQAQHKGWILFFDEADALFGKRTETKDSHDRYANQEVSFLLQRFETFDGIAILASNQKENLDEAFTRRFESIIYFPMPRPEERLLLWQKGFSPKAGLQDSLDLEKVARDYTLSGGSIMNVIRYASLQALKKGDEAISLKDVMEGIHREYAKEGKAR